MKARRHAAIMRIIREEQIQTQEELANKLRERGIAVTQATVSRDIKELRLVKVPDSQGGYYYAPPLEPGPGDVQKRAQRAFQDYVVEVTFTSNLIILKTLSGTANAVAAAIDELEMRNVIATLAGDDVVLVIVRMGDAEGDEVPKGAVAEVLEEFRKLRTTT